MKFKHTTAGSALLLLFAVTACGTGNDGASTSSSPPPATSKAPVTSSTAPIRIAAEKTAAFTVKANPEAGNNECRPNCWLPTQVAPVTVPGESVVPAEKWPNQGDAVQVLCAIETPDKPLRDVDGNTSTVWYKILVPGRWVTDPDMQARVQHVPSLKGYVAYVSQLWVTAPPKGAVAPPCMQG